MLLKPARLVASARVQSLIPVAGEKGARGSPLLSNDVTGRAGFLFLVESVTRNEGGIS